ncbi:MAG: hypothetical protein AB7I30_21465 [Isosphaeraceae bacterium]
MFRLILTLALVFAGVLGASSVTGAHADTILVYTSESAFLGAAGPVTTSTFDDVPPGYVYGNAVAIIDGTTYTAVASHPFVTWRAIDVFSGVSPPNFLDTTASIGDPRVVTFGPNVAVTAFGCYLLFAGFNGRVEVTANAADGTLYSEVIAMSQGTQYRGFTSTVGLTSVAFRSLLTSGGLTNYGFDNVSRGTQAIPEPASLIWVSTALGCLICCSWKRWDTE